MPWWTGTAYTPCKNVIGHVPGRRFIVKKMLCFVLTLCLVLPVCGAFAKDMAPLTVDEVGAFLEVLREAALQDEALTVVPNEDGGYTATFEGGMLYLADDALRENSAIVGAQLNARTEDLRQLAAARQEDEVTVGAALQDVLAAYPCANEELYGTYEEAVIILEGEVPGTAFAGVAYRDGQKVEKVTYYAYETVADETVRAEVTYYFAENYLVYVEVAGAHGVENAQSELENMALLQEEMDYRHYPVSEDGSVLDMFAREDLFFSGIDFLSVTPEEITERFGDMTDDRYMQDEDGSFIRTCTWDGIELTLNYDADRALEGVSMLHITTPLMEGPRGARVGDSATSLMLRFRHGEGEFNGNATVFYGENGTAPYGEVSYQDQGAYLTYLTETPDGTVALYLNCTDMNLTGYLLAVLDAE